MLINDLRWDAELEIDPFEKADGCVLLRLRGALDGGGAYRLRDELERYAGRHVMVDFSRLREASNLALGILALYLTDRHAENVRATGLPQQGEAVLRAFGLSGAVSAA